ncbi:outer membrane protein assembly factor BamE [Vibrio metschnikovii]|nr:outer membrane protein assembly factor BamE [Vibrio parahaemolyticus]EKO3619060.1 outer membrane protein assembly factor BamE [Vibrio metschnikovii]EKO3636370.1 outer membrane protein assembly factor BamE [Vibrio metschnikovii]EKO3653436.1 outer membrane protein assembly factor BamE [Vibrio metschnikovii]EKO3656917.1 outer membrane protein assembly factor BamE [Vibrio metschnikovii]
MKRFFLVFICSLMFLGCAQKINYGQSSLNLELGMTKQEVVGVLGTPRRTDVNDERERWYYWNPTQMGLASVDNEMLSSDKISVTFKDGKLTKWGSQNYMDDVMESQQKLLESTMNKPIKVEQTIITNDE